MTIGPPPRLQDRYRLVEQLGRGSMGLVYQARDELLERDVAIKFIAPEHLSGPEASARFMREARTIARLSHPNIMTLHDAGQAEGWHYLILELLPGHNLHTLMNERGGTLPLRETLPLMRGALKALAHAHAHGIIHRDLKPENIMVAPEGGVKIADFGLAVAHDDVRLTQEGLIVGTILYLAPEVVMGQPADARSDLYAVGAVFYELLTGQPPFTGNDSVSVIAHILHDPLTAPSQFVPGLPAPVEQLILQLLNKDPSARPASAEATLAALPDIVEASAPDGDAPALSAVRASASLLENLIRSSTALEAAPAESAESPLPPALLLYAALEDTTDAVEAERRRLAELLNERLMEPLNLLLAQAGIYEKSLSATLSVRQAFSVLISLLRQLQQQTRDLEANLRPTLLDNLGLEPALESLAAQVTRAHGLQIALTLERLPERLPRPIELALFRAAQEALEHAAGPAHAGQASIHLQKRDEQLTFRLNNNGAAGDAHAIFLPATRQRLEQLGGVIQPNASLSDSGDITIRFTLSAPPPLTPREMDVLQLLAEGLSNKEIALALSVAPRTINFHLDNVYSKLGVNSRTEAALYALRRGWIRKTDKTN
jgi:serine/threonine protein kinase/DNA-binding CsgD family transcriptional regulator